MTQNEQTRKLVITEFGYDPLAALAMGPDANDYIPAGRSKYEDAQKLLAKHGAEFLLPLLESKDRGTAINALFVFSEMGSKGFALIDAATGYLSHPDEDARWYALDGLLFHVLRLSPPVLALCLKAAGDESARIRNKATEFLSASLLSQIKAAHEFLSSEDQIDQHKRGLEVLSKPGKEEDLIDRIRVSGPVVSCYICAKILKAAKLGNFIEITDEQNTSEETDFLKFKLDMMKKYPRLFKNPLGV